MGGNATKHLGTQRLSKEDYNAFCELLNEILSGQWTIPLSYRNKADFGDVDVLATFDLNTLENMLKASDKINLLGRENMSYALQFKKESGWSEPLQLDLIQVKEEDFDFAKHFYAYNDLSNFVVKVAKSAGLKFKHDGLYVVSYFDTDGRLLKNNELSCHKAETKLNVDFFTALEALGFSKERYLKGFDELNDIFQFVLDNPFFNSKHFLLENLNHEDCNKCKKRANYNLALAYFEQFDKEGRDDLNSVIKQKLPVVAYRTQQRKEVKTKILWQRRLRPTRISRLLKIDFYDAREKVIALKQSDFYQAETMNLPSKEFKQKLKSFKL